MLAWEDTQAAISDVEYHRALMFGEADRLRAEQLGQPLVFPHAKGTLPWPQVQILTRVEQAIADKQGEILTVLSSRQTAKNEMDAMLAARMLTVFQGIPGSTSIRTAPTWKPQIVQSKLRLEEHLAADPLIDQDRVRWREGFLVQYGKAMLQFMSGGATSNVVGATASILLSVDEAHKIDGGKFEDDFMPFTASTNAPAVLWGVAADKLDLLHEYRSLNEGTSRLLCFPWHVWAELSEPYAQHCASRKKKLGESHPTWLTQYCLVPCEAAGSYLKEHHRQALFSGDFPRLSGPRSGMAYAILIDIGGESELDADDDAIRMEEPGRDSTAIGILEHDPTEQVGDDEWPSCRLVQVHHWTGKKHVALTEGDSSTLKDLIALAQHWRVTSGVCDARGVGHAVAKGLHRRVPCVQAYEASNVSVSEDCYSLLAMLNAGRVQCYRGDPAADEELRELQDQARWTTYAISGHELLKIMKPTGEGSSHRHIDLVKMLTYAHRALGTPHGGLLEFMRQQVKEQQEAKDKEKPDA